MPMSCNYLDAHNGTDSMFIRSYIDLPLLLEGVIEKYMPELDRSLACMNSFKISHFVNVSNFQRLFNNWQLRLTSPWLIH